jgi:hypothetical protein
MAIVAETKFLHACTGLHCISCLHPPVHAPGARANPINSRIPAQEQRALYHVGATRGRAVRQGHCLDGLQRSFTDDLQCCYPGHCHHNEHCRAKVLARGPPDSSICSGRSGWIETRGEIALQNFSSYSYGSFDPTSSNVKLALPPFLFCVKNIAEFHTLGCFQRPRKGL